MSRFRLSFTVGVENGQEAVESAAVFLFETFHNKDHVGTEETRAIKQMFGPFPASAAEASCAAVAQLVAPLGESPVEDFVRAQSSSRHLQRGSAFGRNIAFSYDSYTLDPVEPPWAGSPEDEVGLDFNSFWSSHQVGRGGGGGQTEEYGSGEPSSHSVDGAILRGEVETYLDGGNVISSSPEELCTSLFEMLASHKSDDELQNEVR